MDPNLVIQSAVSNGPWAVAAVFLGFKVIQAWQEDRKRVDSMVAMAMTDSKAIVQALSRITEQQEEIVRELCEIRKEVIREIHPKR